MDRFPHPPSASHRLNMRWMCEKYSWNVVALGTRQVWNMSASNAGRPCAMSSPVCGSAMDSYRVGLYCRSPDAPASSATRPAERSPTSESHILPSSALPTPFSLGDSSIIVSHVFFHQLKLLACELISPRTQ